MKGNHAFSYTSFLDTTIPSLMQSASFSHHELLKLDRAYEEHMGTLPAIDFLPTTLFDLAAIYPDPDSSMVFRFAEEIGSAISQTGELPHSRGLRGMIQRFLGTDDQDNGYLSGLGELAVLSELLKIPQVRVTAVEPPLPNGKTADFEVQVDSRTYNIEVATVRFDRSRIDTDSDVVAFFKSRATKKLAEKVTGLPEDARIMLVLVIHSADDVEGLLKYENGLYHLCLELEPIGAFWPFVIAPYSHDGGVAWNIEIHPMNHLLPQFDWGWTWRK